MRKQAIKIDLVDALRREDRFCDALRGILVEIDIRRSEGKVEIGDHDLRLEQVGHRPADVVGDRRGSDPALCADESNGPPDWFALGINKDARYDRDYVCQRNRGDHILRNAGPDEIAVERDVVVMADYDDFRARIAIFGELPEAFEQLTRLAAGLDDDQIGCRRGLVKFDCGGIPPM